MVSNAVLREVPSRAFSKNSVPSRHATEDGMHSTQKSSKFIQLMVFLGSYQFQMGPGKSDH